MVTLVGTQENFEDAIKELLELEYDAKEAYEAAINRLENEDYKAQLTEFKEDHVRHINELSALFTDHNLEYTEGPDLKRWLAKGKVVLANLMGDQAVLAAMQTNEVDTNQAYERLIKYSDIWTEAKPILKRALDDERRHKAWLEETLAKAKAS